MRKGRNVMKKFFALMMAALMMMSMLAACGGNAGPEDPKTIRIGLTGPLSGNNAVYGKAVEAGMKIAVEEVNARGGLQFEFKAEDDVSDIYCVPIFNFAEYTCILIRRPEKRCRKILFHASYRQHIARMNIYGNILAVSLCSVDKSVKSINMVKVTVGDNHRFNR